MTGHAKQNTRMGTNVTHAAKHLLEPVDTTLETPAWANSRACRGRVGWTSPLCFSRKTDKIGGAIFWMVLSQQGQVSFM